MRTFMLFIIGLTFGAAGGFVVAAGNGITFDGHDHSDPAHHGTGADHATMDHANMNHGGADHAMMHDTPIKIDAATAPTVDIMVTKDPMTGYNLHVMVDRFTFAPKAASLGHVAGQGHAHVYANGVKLARLYGEWMHLENLPKGDVEITVSLNSNDHHPFMVGDAPVAASQTITVE